MTGVFVGLEVSLEDQADTHGVPSHLCDVAGCLECATQLELVSFDGHDLNQGHFNDQLLRVLVVQTVLVRAPLRSLKVKALDVATELEALLDL